MTTTTEAMTTTTEAMTTTTEAMAAVGSSDNPIKVLFVPSVDSQVIVSGGDIMAQALNQATGLNFEVTVPTSYAATIEEMCASPDNTMGFIPGLGYVLASNRCGVDVAFKAVRYGWAVYWSEVLVQRDSGYNDLSDLDGKKWAYPDTASTSGYMVPVLMFDEAGVTPGEEVEAGGHNQAVTAVYNGSADFGTAFFSPPLMPDGTWDESMSPDIPDDLVSSCAPSEDGSKLMCGDWRVLDARANIRTDAPDVIQKVKILTISPPIPNDTLSFGPDFPQDVRAQIETALVNFSQTDAWAQSIGSSDFYGWTGIEPATDSEYDGLRKIVDLLNYTIND